MTQQKYIKIVKRKLFLPTELRESVLADLKETFETSIECGEDISDVINRIGTPTEFVNDVMENVELTAQQRKYLNRKKTIFRVMIVCVVVALGFSFYCIIQRLRFALNGVIGYANSLTQIKILSSAAEIVPVIGCILLWLIPTAMLIYLFILKKRIDKFNTIDE